MRAILFEAPGRVRVVDDVPAPRPAEGEVLVRCTHLGLCGSNSGPYLGEGRWAATEWPAPLGWMGHENVGVIVESRHPGWPVGTRVVAQSRDGHGYVEQIACGPDAMARLPEGAAAPGAYLIAQPLATVLRALAKTEPVIKQRCAVVGLGPIGLLFTYLLRRMGAAQVIGIDRIAWRLEWARRFGATDTVDASRDDVPQAVAALTHGEKAGLAVEAAGTPQALATAALLPCYGGRLYAFGMPRHDLQAFPWFHTVMNETRVLTCHGPGLREYLQPAVDLVAGDLSDLKALVTPRLPMADAARAFDMYAHPAGSPGCLKLVLEV